MYFPTRIEALQSPLATMNSKLTAAQLEQWLSEQRPRPAVPGLRVAPTVFGSLVRGGTGYEFDDGEYVPFKEFVRGVEDALGLGETPTVSRPAKTLAR